MAIKIPKNLKSAREDRKDARVDRQAMHQAALVDRRKQGDSLKKFESSGNDLLGEGNINSDPLFVDSLNDNYQLLDNSPCIDSGTSYFIFDNNSDFIIDSYDGEAPDMGAYEFLSESQSCDLFPGDVNLDMSLDISDILLTVNFIMGFSTPTLEQVCIADINQDEILDIFDIIIMINTILL